jgi:tRNA (guanine26-N2/guanine27-N2)-dimethyltransferase
MEIKLKKIIEGQTRLFVPDPLVYRSPESAPVFYNPVMKTDRDISVAVLKNFLKKESLVADALSGLGARAVRYANEAGMTVFANDIQPSAVSLIKKNARLNRVKIKTSNQEANLFLMSSKYDKFDCIDIDPFGSPAPFLNSAIRAISPKNGLLCVTATDVGTLSGNYPTACFRRYFIKAQRTSFEHELGVRNLITAVFKEGAKYSFSMEPLLAYYNRHYYRAFMKIAGGKKDTNRNIRNIGFVAYCRKCESRQIFGLFDSIPEKCACKQDIEVLGPTWTGRIGDKDFLEKIRLYNPILEDCYNEADIPNLHYDLHAFAKTGKKKDLPKTSEIMKKLGESGYKTSRTHFNDRGIKTNADYKTVRKML